MWIDAVCANVCHVEMFALLCLVECDAIICRNGGFTTRSEYDLELFSIVQLSNFLSMVNPSLSKAIKSPVVKK